MSYEYRIFFPLNQNNSTNNNNNTSTSSSASSSSPSSDYSLFNLSDFRIFHSTAPVPVGSIDNNASAEDRTDLYLIDTAFIHQNNFGLKFRGVAPDKLFPGGDKPIHIKLELKVRKEPYINSSSSSSPLRQPEEWHKVLRSNIECNESHMIRSLLKEMEQAVTTQKIKAKKKMTELCEIMVELLTKKREKELVKQQNKSSSSSSSPSSPSSSSSSPPFYFVGVSKKRILIPEFDAEQTDIEIAIIDNHSASSSPSSSSSSSPTVYCFRSICFEGEKENLQTKEIETLFNHLLQKYPANSSSSSSTSSSSPLHASVAAYPEFLTDVLRMHLKSHL